MKKGNKFKISMKKMISLPIVLISLFVICMIVVGCGGNGDNAPLEVETGISIPRMTYENGKYLTTVDNDIEEYNLKSGIVLSDGATLTVSKTSDFYELIDAEALSISPGDNEFYLKVVDKYGNYATYTVNIKRRHMYYVEFNTNGGTAVEKQAVQQGGKIQKPSTTKAGYQHHWDYDFDQAIEGNITINAIWTPIEYQISIKNDENPIDIKVKFDSEYDLHQYIPQKTGYRFSGWSAVFGEGENAVSIDFDSSGIFSQTSNITLVPNFKPIEYSITYVVEEGGTNTNTVKTFTIEDVIDLLPAMWKDDEKVFAGWYTTQECIEGTEIDQIAKLHDSIELWAKFDDVVFETKVNFIVNGETIKTDKFIYKSSYSMTAASPQKGYVFDGWYYGETKIDLDGVWPYKNDSIDIVAKFNERINSIEYHLNGGTNNESNPSEYNVEMGVKELKAPTFGRHVFLGWFIDEAFQTPITELTVDNVTEEMDIYAKWQYKSYVIFDANGGECDVADATFTFGEAFTLPTPILAGNLFDGWYYINGADESSAKITGSEWKYKEDVTLVARYTPTEYAINYELNGGTQNEANPEIFGIFTGVIQLLPPTKNDAQFMGWFTDAGFTNAITEIDTNVVKEITLYAKWFENTKTINYDANGGSVARPTENIVFGHQYVLPTPEFNGYNFDGWYYGNVLVPTTGTWSIADNVVELKAKWSAITYKIEYDLAGKEVSDTLVKEYSVETGDIKLPKLTHSEYLFLGWRNANGDLSLNVTIPSGTTGDLSYKAVWIAKRDGKGFVYEFFGDYMACVDYVRPVDASRSMQLPRTYGGYPVEVIGERAFSKFGEKYANSEYKNQNYYYTILIPTTIKVIEADAFANCSGMCVMLYLDNYKLVEDIKNPTEKAALKEWEANMTYSIVENESNTNTQVRDCIWGFRPAIGWSRYSAVDIPADYYDKKN